MVDAVCRKWIGSGWVGFRWWLDIRARSGVRWGSYLNVVVVLREVKLGTFVSCKGEEDDDDDGDNEEAGEELKRER